MSLEIAIKALWDQRRGFVGWGVGLALATAIYTGFYAVTDPTTYSTMLDTFPQSILDAFGWTDFASPSGYLGATVYGLVIPILVAIFAIAFGTRMIAGDEESGTLELIVTHPVSRVSIVLQRAVAVVAACFGAAAVVFLVVAVLSSPVGLTIPLSYILAASYQLGLFGSVFGLLALAIGGFVGRRGVVIGSCAAIAVLSYFGNTLVPQVEGLAWFENLSIFHFYDGPQALREGLAAGGSLLLILLGVALTAAAAIGFSRRDVGV
jgi:ABC-2 type transport system permease protein